MPDDVLLGYLIIALGGACGGSFGLPSKFVSKKMEWEHLWLPFFVIATLLIPLTCGPFLVKGLWSIYQTAGLAPLLLPFLFGILWGFGSMSLGLVFGLIGLSLGYAINYGGQIVVGMLGPTVASGKTGVLGTPEGIVLLCGAAVCLLGVVICAFAGIQKAASEEGSDAKTGISRKKMLIGLIAAVISGALCACWAIAATYGNVEGGLNAVTKTALGADADWRTTLPTTFVILLGGSLSSCGYCLFKLCKNKSWGGFRQGVILPTLLIALSMALLHDCAVAFFGIGADKIRGLGGSVGYAVFMSLAIITGNVNGLLTAEWRRASRVSKYCMLTGILALVLGVITLSTGNYLVANADKTEVSEPVISEP